VKVDGNRCPTLSIRSEAVIGGDALIKQISAASILAKVTRDRMLVELHETFPMYGFATHSGYGTPQHLKALKQHGPCEHHRRSFAPVREAHALFFGSVLPVIAPEVIQAASSVEDDPDALAF
jgi:ribonuclease HII